MKCDSPLKIINPYTNKPITVGCRHCDSCRIASANAKTLLLMNELKKATFPLFVTLTYDNDHLPVVFNGSDKVLRLSAPGVFDVIGDLPERVYIEPKRPYHYPYKSATGVIWYRDIQLFIKRLRINLNRNGKGNFRFFACCEYGTVRKRPHAHLLFFFSKLSDLRGIEQLICKSWRMCDKTRLLEGVKFADVAVGSIWLHTLTAIAIVIHLQNINFLSKKPIVQKLLIMGAQRKIKKKLNGLSVIDSINHLIFVVIPDLLNISTSQGKVAFPLALFRKEFFVPTFEGLSNTVQYLLSVSVYALELSINYISERCRESCDSKMKTSSVVLEPG